MYGNVTGAHGASFQLLSLQKHCILPQGLAAMERMAHYESGESSLRPWGAAQHRKKQAVSDRRFHRLHLLGISKARLSKGPKAHPRDAHPHGWRLEKAARLPDHCRPQPALTVRGTLPPILCPTGRRRLLGIVSRETLQKVSPITHGGMHQFGERNGKPL